MLEAIDADPGYAPYHDFLRNFRAQIERFEQTGEVPAPDIPLFQ